METRVQIPYGPLPPLACGFPTGKLTGTRIASELGISLVFAGRIGTGPDPADPSLDIVPVTVKSDAQLQKLREETGSAFFVRLPFSLFGIIMNFEFFLNGWRDPPPWFWVVFAGTWVVMAGPFLMKMVRVVRSRGLLFGWAHPILAARWTWWLLIWPAPNEPLWRRLFAVGTLAWVGIFSTAGFLRWGFSPY